jgi:hypothetical protein
MSDTVYIPRRSSVGVGKETVRGTGVSAAYWIPFTSMALTDQPEVIQDTSSIGSIEEGFSADNVYTAAAGAIEGNVYDNSIGLFLLSMFGAVSTAANDDTSGDVNDHTFTVANNNSHPTLTISEKNPNRDARYALAMVDKLTIKAAAKQFATFTADMKSHASATASNSVAIVEGNRFIPSDITFKMATDVAGLASATAIPLKSITATFSQNANDDPDELGSTSARDMFNTTWSSQIEIEGLYRNNDIRDAVMASTKMAVELKLANSAATIGDAAHPSLTFTFQPGFFNPWKLSTGQNDLVSQTATLHGLYSTSTSKSVDAVLTNTETSY